MLLCEPSIRHTRFRSVTFEKAPYEIGSQPFEIGRYGPEVKVDEDETSFTILGDETGGNSSGLHIGHAISEITK